MLTANPPMDRRDNKGPYHVSQRERGPNFGPMCTSPSLSSFTLSDLFHQVPTLVTLPFKHVTPKLCLIRWKLDCVNEGKGNQLTLPVYGDLFETARIDIPSHRQSPLYVLQLREDCACSSHMVMCAHACMHIIPMWKVSGGLGGRWGGLKIMTPLGFTCKYSPSPKKPSLRTDGGSKDLFPWNNLHKLWKSERVHCLITGIFLLEKERAGLFLLCPSSQLLLPTPFAIQLIITTQLGNSSGFINSSTDFGCT